MKYFQFSSGVVIVVLLLIQITYAFVEPANDAKSFLDYFSIKENSFVSAYALSTLSEQDRDNICNNFSEYEDVTSFDSLLVVRVDSIGNNLMVPAFLCESKSSNSSFLVTYSKNNEYFELQIIGCPSDCTTAKYEKIVKLIRSKKIPLFANHLSQLQKKTINHFQSAEYRKHAKQILSIFIANSGWINLCKKFYPNYNVPKSYKDAHILESDSAPINEEFFPGVPSVLCPLEGADFFGDYVKIFHVAYFGGNIFFVISDDAYIVRGKKVNVDGSFTLASYIIK